ncbi:MAG: hypothetical protein WDN69_34655 [Aliidongia sp.]
MGQLRRPGLYRHPQHPGRRTPWRSGSPPIWSGATAPRATSPAPISTTAIINRPRLSLDWKPAPNFENYTVIDGFSSHEHNEAQKLVGIGTCQSIIIACFFTPGSGNIPIPPGLPFFAPGAANLPAALAEANALGPRTVDIPAPQLAESNVYGMSNTSTVKLTDTPLGDITFKNIVGYRHESDTSALDLSGSPIAFLDVRTATRSRRSARSCKRSASRPAAITTGCSACSSKAIPTLNRAKTRRILRSAPFPIRRRRCSTR